MASHIIQKQILEINATGKTLNWEESASAFQRDIITKILEDCFNNFPMGDQHLVIDKLEIDLGTFSVEKFFTGAREMLIQQMTDSLRKAHRDWSAKTDRIDFAKENSSSTNPNDTISNVEGNYSGNAVPSDFMASDSEAHFKAFLVFMETGRFPWWYPKEEQQKTLEEQFNIFWTKELNGTGKSAIREKLHASYEARMRIAGNFSADWMREFLLAIGIKIEAGQKQWKLLGKVLVKFPQLLNSMKQHFWATQMEEGHTTLFHPSIKNLLDKTCGRDKALYLRFQEKLQDVCFENLNNPGLSNISKLYLNELTEILSAADKKEIEKSILEIKGSTTELPRADFLQENNSLPKTNQAKINTEENELYISGAGMVLLHPFLGELFLMTGLWAGNSWSSEQAQHRAVKILSFLSYGEMEADEHDLVFHKVLTGMHPDTVLLSGEELSMEETTACGELLEAIITHWTALRNTSPEALRQAFLQREGKLIFKDSGDTLFLERKTQDILLSRLPWGYSMLKLPWMERMLHVSWA